MSIVNMHDMLNYAYQNKFAVAAFEVFSLRDIHEVISTAQKCHSPVILNIPQSDIDDAYFEMILVAAEAAAKQASIPVAIHLNDSSSIDAAIHAINAGCNSVMIDTSYKSLMDNMQVATELTNITRGCGVPVEACLAVNSALTSKSIKHFVEKTAIDFLCLVLKPNQSAGSAQNEPDLSLLEQIRALVKIPLSVEAQAEYSDDWFAAAIAGGVGKISFKDKHSESRTAPYSENFGANLHSEIIEICLRKIGSVYKQSELIEHCQPWLPVEHLIIYNVNGLSPQETRAMMLEGQLVLSKIPGVRSVEIGRATDPGAKYQLVWLIRFCHPSVIGSYRDHPLHVAFANNLFRPVAGDRISIDYQVA